MSWPSSLISPLTRQPTMVSFMRFRQRRNVDLPQPEGPIERDDLVAAHVQAHRMDGMFFPIINIHLTAFNTGIVHINFTDRLCVFAVKR